MPATMLDTERADLAMEYLRLVSLTPLTHLHTQREND